MQPVKIADLSIIDMCKKYHGFDPADGLWQPVGPGLRDNEALDTALKDGDYKYLLIAVWTENDLRRKVTWLREREAELHVPLLYELALTECDAGSHNTVTNICYPLLTAADFRAKQDCFIYPECVTKKRPPFEKMHAIYCQAMEERLNAFISRPKLNPEAIYRKMASMIKVCQETRLPKITWIDLPMPDDEEEDLIARRIFAAYWLQCPH